MFRKLGAERTGRDDRRLAAYLAVIAGAVNSAGFVLVGSFTSHVTGNVGRLVDQVVVGDASVALIAGATIATFFLGALLTSMAIESGVLGTMSRTSAGLLLMEAALIASFVACATLPVPAGSRLGGTHAVLLSAAMGMQNSLVTRLSGAVVRTTHLTGVVTDLGIEGARWFRYWRSRAGETRRMRFTLTSTPALRPHAPKVALLGTIFVAFVVGSAFGALFAVRYSYLSLLPVVALLLAGAVYASLLGGSVVRVPSKDNEE